MNLKLDSDLCMHEGMIWWSQPQHFYSLLFMFFFTTFQVFVKITKNSLLFFYSLIFLFILVLGIYIIAIQLKPLFSVAVISECYSFGKYYTSFYAYDTWTFILFYLYNLRMLAKKATNKLAQLSGSNPCHLRDKRNTIKFYQTKCKGYK